MSLNIAKEFHAERNAQKAKWGDDNDDKLRPGEWASLISHYATRHTFGDFQAIDSDEFRSDMVKVGALAMAAIAAVERKVP
jgi:hypothetical protein